MNWRDKTDEELQEIADRSDALFGEVMLRTFNMLIEVRDWIREQKEKERGDHNQTSKR